MGSRLPSREDATLVGFDPDRLGPDEQLPPCAVRRRDREVGLEHSLGRRQNHSQGIRDVGATRAARHLGFPPAQDLRKESPQLTQSWTVIRLVTQERPDRLRIDPHLLRGHELVGVQRRRGDDYAEWLDFAEPDFVGIAWRFRTSSHQPVAGQR